MNKKQKGFSLIELLIVVAIILIIAAIAIPNLLRSRMAANEASAVGSIRTMNTAAITYSSTYGNGFPPTLAAIGTTGTAAVELRRTASLLDTVLTAGHQERLRLRTPSRHSGGRRDSSDRLHDGGFRGRLRCDGETSHHRDDRAAQLLLGCFGRDPSGPHRHRGQSGKRAVPG